MADFDPGPPADVAKLFAAVPSYAALKTCFWFDWGPVFYRGRLNRSARVLCIASDPGATERIAHRTLVGDAGQRVQGFLGKLGLTRSYLCLNAFAYSLIPDRATAARPLLEDPAQVKWRSDVFARVTGPALQAIVAFGTQARQAVDLWEGRGTTPVFKVPHPSSHDPVRLVTEWAAAITALRNIVTPDSKKLAKLPNYGPQFTANDYAPIPRRDLPFGVPAFLGDDSWVRAISPAHPSSVARPQPDDRHTLIWKAPSS